MYEYQSLSSHHRYRYRTNLQNCRAWYQSPGCHQGSSLQCSRRKFLRLFFCNCISKKYLHNCDGRSLIQTILRIHIGESGPRLLYRNFYGLSSLFALKSFLSSQCTNGNTVLREVSVFLGICLFFIRIEGKFQKKKKQKEISISHFVLCSIFR